MGQGDDKPKSATKPVSIETLADLDILRCVFPTLTGIFWLGTNRPRPCHITLRVASPLEHTPSTSSLRLMTDSVNSPYILKLRILTKFVPYAIRKRERAIRRWSVRRWATFFHQQPFHSTNRHHLPLLLPLANPPMIHSITHWLLHHPSLVPSRANAHVLSVNVSTISAASPHPSPKFHWVNGSAMTASHMANPTTSLNPPCTRRRPPPERPAAKVEAPSADVGGPGSSLTNRARSCS